MARRGRGPVRGPVARLNEQVLRLVGLGFVGWAGVVIWASLRTDYGLSVTLDPTTRTAVADPGTVRAVVAFALAHPAYGALLAVGLVLLALGDEAPLLGA